MTWWRWKKRGQSTNKNYRALTKKGHVGSKWVKFPPKTWEILTCELQENGTVRLSVGGTSGGLAITPVPPTQNCQPAWRDLGKAPISYQRNKNLKFSLWDSENRNQHNRWQNHLKFPSQVNIDLLSKEKANQNKIKIPEYRKRFSTQKKKENYFEESEQMFNLQYKLFRKSRDF